MTTYVVQCVCSQLFLTSIIVVIAMIMWSTLPPKE